jgi:hypothetical protein
MKRFAPTFLLFLLLASRVVADGFNPAPLSQVLSETDVIIQVEILKNEGTTTHRDAKDGRREMVVYTNDIKTRVISTHLGKYPHAEYNTKYSLTLVKGVWLGISGSGLESRMAPGEKYVLMLREVNGAYNLQRAEKAENLDEVLRLRKELDDEDRRVAEAQAKMPNGIYHSSDEATARRVRLEDGRRVRIGEPCTFDIVRKELRTVYNETFLCLTLRSEKPRQCILIVDGKAYWFFDHHWAAQEKHGGAEESAKLYCPINDRKNAEAVGVFFDIAITDAQAQTHKAPVELTQEQAILIATKHLAQQDGKESYDMAKPIRVIEAPEYWNVCFRRIDFAGKPNQGLIRVDKKTKEPKWVPLK